MRRHQDVKDAGFDASPRATGPFAVYVNGSRCSLGEQRAGFIELDYLSARAEESFRPRALRRKSYSTLMKIDLEIHSKNEWKRPKMST